MKWTYLTAAAIAMIAVACNNTSNQQADKTIATDTTATSPALESVFADSVYQLTGVAIAADNRLFTNYPYWLDQHDISVAEIKDGKAIPYPDAAWNSFKKGEDGQNKFVCIQSVVADDKGFLWVVDAAGIGLGNVYNKANKVVKINLATNLVERIYHFPDSVAGENVYLNDIRIDNKNGYAYLTNSNTGGIVVLNINSGQSRLVLAKSSSVISDTAYHFSPLGTELKKGDGSLLKVNSDGIALTPDNQWLYYKPLTDDRLYRINTSWLQNFAIPHVTLENKVEDLGHFITTDGMLFDKQGNLYLGDLEQNSIVKITPDLKMHTLIQDKEQLLWPDSYSISADGYLYISASQIQYMPWFHQGKDAFSKPFHIYRIKL